MSESSKCINIFAFVCLLASTTAPAFAQRAIEQATTERSGEPPSAVDHNSSRTFQSAPALAPAQQFKLPEELGAEEDDKLHPRNKPMRPFPKIRTIKTAPMQTGVPQETIEDANCIPTTSPLLPPPYNATQQGWFSTRSKALSESASSRQSLQSWQLAPPERQLIQIGRGTSFAPRPFNFLQFSNSLRH